MIKKLIVKNRLLRAALARAKAKIAALKRRSPPTHRAASSATHRRLPMFANSTKIINNLVAQNAVANMAFFKAVESVSGDVDLQDELSRYRALLDEAEADMLGQPDRHLTGIIEGESTKKTAEEPSNAKEGEEPIEQQAGEAEPDEMPAELPSGESDSDEEMPSFLFARELDSTERSYSVHPLTFD